MCICRIERGLRERVNIKVRERRGGGGEIIKVGGGNAQGKQVFFI